ncbi:hypothetical protein V6B41_002540 [Yersinia enterocolitica]
MAVHVVTGKLGSGKTLVTIGRIQDYLARGRIVATNQIFSANYERGAFCLIPPFFTHGQFSIKRDFEYYMRITKIYFKRMNRIWIMASFLSLGAAIGILYKSGKNDLEIKALNETLKKENVNKIDQTAVFLPKLSISSFSQMGYDVSVIFKDIKGIQYYSFDFIKDGYSIDIKDACHVTIRKDKYIQKITCEG